MTAHELPPELAAFAETVASRRVEAPAAKERPDWVREPDGEGPGSRVRELIELAEKRGRRGSVILDAPPIPESRWGDGHRCLWARGEPFLLCGSDGVGKTTLAQQLALGTAGIRPGMLLGLGVAAAGARTLYLACDRPSQALRSFRRMVSEDDRSLLDERLVIWRGPLPFDLVKEPTGLFELCRRFEADTVFIDSLKDIATDLTGDEGGQRVNTALQHCVAAGIDVAALHHQRKAQAGAPKPKALADVYGSRWLTAGCGSVVMLWGEPGDAVVELLHVKQVDEQLGPWSVLHDHVRGETTLHDAVDAWTVVHDAHKGMSATTVARIISSPESPDKNAIERARRQLDRLAVEGKVHRQDGARGGGLDRQETLYFPIEANR